ncbi:synaptopodin [Kryptolebias marmoratus]|uniref:Synaptopodin n=2 Tax=Kryptolebias marmoratus TaxID=37003 RepID=A0A3Q3BIM5_KRYMA|nr:synaptopodin [Kryptolebias marmoratus]
MERGHVSVRRGVSWSPGGLRKPLQLKEDARCSGSDENTPWERMASNGEHVSRKTSLTRSASLSEKELREARLKSQIIAAQLTVPSNSSSTSRGVQLFNRRKQRVNAFTHETSGRGSEVDETENVKNNPSSDKPTWAECSSEEKNKDLNLKNTKPLVLSPLRTVGDIMDEPSRDFHQEHVDNSIIQERHFLPVKEEEEEEETKEEIQEVLKDNVMHGTPLERNHTDTVQMAHVDQGTETNEGHAGLVSSKKLPNGCHSTSGPERASIPPSKQAATTLNRTARPFFSPPTVLSSEAASPVMNIPPPPSYSTPPLPFSAVPHPVTFSPLPPPPSYPTPPLPAFTNQPPQTFYSSPPPMSPVMPASSPLPSQFPVSQHPPVRQCGPPTAPKPSTFVPHPSEEERKLITPIKTGILEEGTARRATKKSMFTFKEKQVVAPNPELLSLVQGADERKKLGHRSVPEPVSEEELMALGAEASNFLAKEESRTEGAKAPEWTSCLKSSKTRPRVEHQPEQTLTNVSGKGAELFAKRQSRMEKYVVENQNVGQIRSPSPAMSLPPSWVYPSNMPGRVKAIAKNSDMSAQLSQNLKAQQAVKQKPRPRAASPEPVPEPTALENGCSKIEMDLSRHRPYQLNSSLFVFNPVKDPISTLPRGAPQAKNPLTTSTFPKQTSLTNSTPPRFQSMSPQLPLSPTRAPEHPSNPTFGHPRISSPLSAFSPERVSSPRSGVQAPRPTFSAKKAGITPQVSQESSTGEVAGGTPTPTSTPSIAKRFSSPDGPISRTWTSSSQTNQPSAVVSGSIRSVTSPVTSSGNTKYQPLTTNQSVQCSAGASASTPRPSQTPTSPCSPPWGSRCQSPAVGQSSTPASFRSPEISKIHSPLSPPWGAKCQSPTVSRNNKTSTAASFSTSRPSLTPQASSPLSPPWGSRSQSPAAGQNIQFSTGFSVPVSRPSQTSLWGSRSQSPAASQNTHFSTISTSRPSQTPPWGSRCQSPLINQNTQSSTVTISTSRPTQTSTSTSPACPPWGSRSQSPALFQSSLSFQPTNPPHTSTTSPPPRPKDSRCMSPDGNSLDSRVNHRLLAKNIINAAKRKNSPSPGALSGHSLPISPVGHAHHDWQKSPIGHFQSRSLGAQSPTFTSPPPTPTQRICSPVRLYNTRSLTDSDASVESEDSGLRSPGLHSYHTCPRGWGSLRVKRGSVSTDL